MYIRGLTKSKFDDVERIVCIVRVMQALCAEHKLIANYFEKCGLLAGYNEVVRHFSTSCFRAGISQRDPNLPEVSAFYVRNVLSLENLFASRNAPITIPKSIISSRQRDIEDYVTAGRSFHRSYFAIGAADEVEDNSSLENRMLAGINVAGVVVDGIRKLFKLGKAVNISRGAPGRISTAFDSLASASDQWDAAVLAENSALKSIAEKSARMEARYIADTHERPVTNLFIAKPYMNFGSRLTRKTILEVVARNRDVLGRMSLSASTSRKDTVDSFFRECRTAPSK